MMILGAKPDLWEIPGMGLSLKAHAPVCWALGSLKCHLSGRHWDVAVLGHLLTVTTGLCPFSLSTSAQVHQPGTWSPNSGKLSPSWGFQSVSAAAGRTGESWTSPWVMSPWSLMLRGRWKPASSPTSILVFWNLHVQAFAKPDHGGQVPFNGTVGEGCSRPTSCPLELQTHLCFWPHTQGALGRLLSSHFRLLQLLYYWLISFPRHPWQLQTQPSSLEASQPRMGMEGVPLTLRSDESLLRRAGER